MEHDAPTRTPAEAGVPSLSERQNHLEGCEYTGIWAPSSDADFMCLSWEDSRIFKSDVLVQGPHLPGK